MALHGDFTAAASRYGSRIAIREPSGQTITYQALDRLSERVRDRLAALGVRRGDRVGLCLHKSIDSVATIFGVLKCGAAYVPVDPTAPATRNGYILGNCTVRAVVAEAALQAPLAQELDRAGATPAWLSLEGVGAGAALGGALDRLDAAGPAPATATVESQPDELAYILYTSGSTGKPKGVMLSHRNAQSFVDWCTATFSPTPEDRFSSHAPFHFDLSILDIYTPLKHGAMLALIPEDIGKDPLALSNLIADARITVWYSTPSILTLLVQYGKLETHDCSSVRTVLFAGEVFPVVHLRALKEQWPAPRYYNLYGPTETNVCTWYEIPATIAADRTEPVPIGRVCSHLEGVVLDDRGAPVGHGQEGELCIRGSGVMQGYWSLPELTQRAFVTLPDGGRWYKTGDLVIEEADGNLRFLGRKDRMVKKRGYRVELGEIEVCLYRHPQVWEAAVVALPDPQAGLRIKAHIYVKGSERMSIIELKRHCSQHLPLYMIPDLFAFHRELPKTSTDKTDYQRLLSLG